MLNKKKKIDKIDYGKIISEKIELSKKNTQYFYTINIYSEFY